MQRRSVIQLLAAMGLSSAAGLYFLRRNAAPEPETPAIEPVQVSRLAISSAPTAVNALRIPELVEGELSPDGRLFSLNVQAGKTRFFEEFETATLGINGSYLGPTLLLRMGEQIHIDVRNGIDEPTTMHWHGLHVPARQDGGPHQVIPSGGHWRASFVLDQKASTCWYHSHLHHQTGQQVYRGLAGMLIVENEESRGLGLPSRYGVDDFPLILQDRRFTESGELDYPTDVSTLMRGVRGDTLLINGTVAPYLEVTTDKVRFRVINAANARSFTIARHDGASFHIIATDNSFLEQALSVDRLTLSPGERAEIVLDMTAGEEVYLVNLPVSPFPSMYNGQMNGMMRNLDQDAFDVLLLRAAATLEAMPALPEALTTINWLREEDANELRYFELGMGNGPGNGGGREGRGASGRGNGGGNGGGFGGAVFTLNGNMMDMGVINFEVQEGAIEIWELRNVSPMIHPFHIHKVHFQILDRDGLPPPPEERGLKDTVRVHVAEVVRVIAHFDRFPDPETPYMYHCHILEHEDHGMMGQFVVV